MKQYTKRFAGALAVVGGLIIASSAQAQYTTNVLSDFHNFNLSVAYANWDQDGSQIINGGNGYAPTIASGSLSYTVEAEGYGSGAYNFAGPIDASGATMFQLTFTINNTMVHPDTTGLWFGPNLTISDGTHQVFLTALNAGANFRSYGPYVGPGTYTLYGTLADQNGGANLDPSTITAFNLEVDPAEYGAGAPYSITYQSLALLTPVPEPATLALLAVGAAGVVAVRRRAKTK